MAKKVAGVFYVVALLFVVLVGFIASSPQVVGPRPQVVLDPYGPPYKVDESGLPGLPVNVETRGLGQDYTQLGILNRAGDLILPLMGRRLMTDRWQYYTISNTGNMNTKLPITSKGRSCSGEYGCDALFSGDAVFVEGYNDTFKVTLYETAKFNYIPYV